MTSLLTRRAPCWQEPEAGLYDVMLQRLRDGPLLDQIAREVLELRRRSKPPVAAAALAAAASPFKQPGSSQAPPKT